MTTTPDEDAVLFVMNALDACGAKWMLTGSLASNMFGVARSTQDADFVIENDDQAMKSFRVLLDDRFEFDGQMKFETITISTRYDMVFRPTGFKIELFLLAEDAFARERFERRIQRDFCGRPAWVPTPEDVVIQKVRWSKRASRKKDMDDATNVIAVQNDRMDWKHVERWCREHGTLELLHDLRQVARRLMD